MNQNPDLVPEDQDERLPLRSQNSSIRTSFRVHNKSSMYISVSWVDYQGIEKEYQTLAPEQTGAYNTYVTHPWVFRDKFSQKILPFKCLDSRVQLPCEKVFYPSVISLELYLDNSIFSLEDLAFRSVCKNFEYFRAKYGNKNVTFPIPIQEKVKMLRKQQVARRNLLNACEHHGHCQNE